MKVRPRPRRFIRKARALMVAQTKQAEAQADQVDREVVQPLQQKRDRLEHNHLAQIVAEGLGIIQGR